VEEKPDREHWKRLLGDGRPEVRTEAVRWWRKFEGDREMTGALVEAAPQLLKKDAALSDDLASVLTDLKASGETMKKLGLSAPGQDRDELGRQTLKALAAASGDELKRRGVAGGGGVARHRRRGGHRGREIETP